MKNPPRKLWRRSGPHLRVSIRVILPPKLILIIRVLLRTFLSSPFRSHFVDIVLISFYILFSFVFCLVRLPFASDMKMVHLWDVAKYAQAE